MKKIIRDSCFILVTTALILELALQFLDRAGKDTNNLLLKVAHKRIFGSSTWEEYFLDNYGKGTLVYQGLYRPDPTLGWSLKPGIRQSENGKVFTSNSQGYRSLVDFQDLPEKYQVLVVGDSFTFGDDIGDEATWPHLLSKKNHQLNVMNMSGSGYGADQMLLALEKEIGSYQPDLVIAAFISDDLYRSTIGFRDFKKPQFELRDKKLVLINTPIGSLDEVAEEARSASQHHFLRTVNAWRYLSRQKHVMEKGPCNRSCFELNQAIFERMSTLARERHADFLMIYLPVYPETIDSHHHLPGEAFFESYRNDHEGYYLNPRPAMISAPFTKSRGHYKQAENELIGNLVYSAIEQMPSWHAHVSAQ